MDNIVQATTTIGLTDDNKQIAFRFINVILCGKKTIPLKQICSKEHQELHSKICRHRRLLFELRVLPNGDFQIMKINDKDISDKELLI